MPLKIMITFYLKKSRLSRKLIIFVWYSNFLGTSSPYATTEPPTTEPPGLNAILYHNAIVQSIVMLSIIDP